ncbi:transketolase [Quadrisphaera sp. KR29]|uniref:transketolase n=1 Tax=Quadrisphaera sp. KR29 TaxID=3461391 RepID=UPI0040445271
MTQTQTSAPTGATGQLTWDEVDQRAVDTVRALAADAVQKVGNGHPGTAISLAPLAYLLYQKLLRHDPADTTWDGRDRFVLSAGHSALTQYIQLYLGGFGLELEDLQALRTWGSKTPGHPEYQHTKGVEVTTGPLGQGVANAVGMAMAARRERGLLDPDAAPGESVFDHHVVAIASDGDLEEGISGEASSLAGTQELGNLTVVYDQNSISIEDQTDIAFTEDVAKRYEAYGWHVQTVDWTRGGSHADGEGYREDVQALWDALQAARAETTRPSFVVLRTIIAWPTPKLQNTGKSHGSALGDEAVKGLKAALGLDPEKTFAVDDEVLERTRGLAARAQEVRGGADGWDARFAAWREANPERAALLDRLKRRELPQGWTDALKSFPAGKDVSTRKASGEVLSGLAGVLPELWGGSADLAESNNTTMEGEPSFLPSSRQTPMWKGGPYGRTLHFGIREHAMGAAINGIVLHGGTRAYGGTFLTFSDYMRPSVRLAALMQIPSIFVWTHDSIGLGEDGPTHQPVEHVSALRLIPGLAVVRPADANETAYAWRGALEHTKSPTGLVLSRQNLPVFERGEGGFGAAEGTLRGGYVLVDAEGDLQVVLVATGSEVQVAVAAREQLQAQGIGTRVVSMPCREWFAEQDDAYRASVLPPSVRARVSVEAGVAAGWRDVVGDAGRTVSLEHFGASADGARLMQEFGFTAENVVEKAHESLRAAAGGDSPGSVSGSSSPTGGTGDR